MIDLKMKDNRLNYFERELRTVCLMMREKQEPNFERTPYPKEKYCDPVIEMAWLLFDRTVLQLVTTEVDLRGVLMDRKTEMMLATAKVDAAATGILGLWTTSAPQPPAGPTRDMMVEKLMEVKDHCGHSEAKRIVREVGRETKMRDIPENRIADVVNECNKVLADPGKRLFHKPDPLRYTEPPAPIEPLAVPAPLTGIVTAVPKHDALTEAALTMARNLSDEKNFSNTGMLGDTPFLQCRYCGVTKQPSAIICWTHRESCIVNTALQTIENYADDSTFN